MNTFSLSFGRLPSKTVKSIRYILDLYLRSLKGIWILYFSGSNCWNLVEGIFLSKLDYTGIGRCIIKDKTFTFNFFQI